jgi:hypothetical protein
MANFSTLDVVNGCLATMGESPLNAVDNDHPFVQSALLTLSNSLTLELSRGWWFNIDQVELKLDALTGFVYLPNDTLALDTQHTQLVQRGRRLFDRTNQTYDLRDFMSTTQAATITGVLTREVPFEDLPTMARHLVAARTWLDFQARYDADSMRYQELHQTYKLVNASLSAQDIRNSNANMFNSPGVAEKLRRIRPLSLMGLNRRN